MVSSSNEHFKYLIRQFTEIAFNQCLVYKKPAATFKGTSLWNCSLIVGVTGFVVNSNILWNVSWEMLHRGMSVVAHHSLWNLVSEQF